LKNILAVLPTIRNLNECIEWTNVFEKFKTTFIVVQDGDEEDIKIPKAFHNSCEDVILLRWNDIDSMLKEDKWIISRFDSAIRCAGWLWAKVNGIKFDYVFTFDDDTKPLNSNHFQMHLNNLSLKAITSMYNTIPKFNINDNFLPRGILGGEKEVILSHGLWLTVPDFDAETQIKFNGKYSWQLPEFIHEIPKGVLFPMCGMNIFFKSDLAPAMYFGLMGKNHNKESWGIGRWDDMFAGWISKLWIDYIDAAVITGSPYCDHLRLSDPNLNLGKEALWKDDALCELLLKLNQWNIEKNIEGKNINEFYLNLFNLAKNYLVKKGSIKYSINHFLKNLEASVLYSKYFFN